MTEKITTRAPRRTAKQIAREEYAAAYAAVCAYYGVLEEPSVGGEYRFIPYLHKPTTEELTAGAAHLRDLIGQPVKPASDKQLAFLKKLGCDTTGCSLNIFSASLLIDLYLEEQHLVRSPYPVCKGSFDYLEEQQQAVLAMARK